MNSIGAYIILTLAGAGLGYAATIPQVLRKLRRLDVVILPVVICSFYAAWARVSLSATDRVLSALLVLLAAAGLAMTIAPSVAWYFSRQKENFVARLDGTAIDEDEGLKPVRELVEADKYEEACRLLESLLKNHRATFPALLLMTQLYHHLKQDQRAEQCLQFMIHLSHGEEEQLTAQRLYHQLTSA